MAERVTAEQLFRSIFLPLYPPDAAADLAHARATDANPANNAAIAAHLDDAAKVFVRQAPALFGEDLALDFSGASIRRLSAALTRERRDAWTRAGAAGTADNELFNAVVHGAAYVGACVVAEHGGAWSVRRPLWESMVRLKSRAGEAELAVFHWLLKSLADDADATLADRYRAHVEIPCARPEELPRIAPPDRALPRIAKVRYDVLYKYLKAHLPELRDVGRDFPTPERFEAFGFKWLEFALVGDGRMLVMHGQGKHGVSMFWLTANGFEKSAFYAADAFPEHRVKIDGEKIVVILSVDGNVVTHEMLWWGP
jgi:hypothetical protein